MLDRDYFFSFEGRAPRSEYWLFIGISIGYVFLMEIVVPSLVRSSGPEVSVEILPVVGFPRSGGPFEFLLFVLSLPLYWPALAIGVRRLHDRNKGSEWAWLLLGVPMLAKLTMVLLDMGRMNLGIFRYPYFLILTASVAVSVWALVELGFLRGTEGDNRFGPDPLPAVVRLPSGEKFYQGLAPGGHRVRLAVHGDDGRTRNEYYYVAESDPERARAVLRDAKGARDEDVSTIDSILHETVERLNLKAGEFAPVPRVG
jgi:uncharacterized membrane protein YhaH (DUF805 family)